MLPHVFRDQVPTTLPAVEAREPGARFWRPSAGSLLASDAAS
jgi:hypothetical protein